MTIRHSRYKLQRLNMDLRNSDLHQFQPRLRALTDFLVDNHYCNQLTSKLDRNDPRYEGWSVNLITKKEVDLNLSQTQRASLGFQTVNHFSGKGSSEIIGLTHFLCSDTHLNSHVRAFYDTFVEPLCDWLGEQLELLENEENPSQLPKDEIEQLIIKGEELRDEAEFDEDGGLLDNYKTRKTEWISDAKQFLEEHAGVTSEIYKDFNISGCGVVYDFDEGHRDSNIEQFQLEMGRRIAYLSSFRKTLVKQKSKNDELRSLVSKEDISKAINFVKNAKLKHILVRDLYEAQLCMTCSYKSVVTLCGGAVEALLVYRLSQGTRKIKAVSEFIKRYPKAKKPSDLSTWSFEQVIDVARQIKMIDEGLRSAFHSIRNFRNFVHPYREVNSTSIPDIHLANMALEGALHLLGISK